MVLPIAAGAAAAAGSGAGAGAGAGAAAGAGGAAAGSGGTAAGAGGAAAGSGGAAAGAGGAAAGSGGAAVGSNAAGANAARPAAGGGSGAGKPPHNIPQNSDGWDEEPEEQENEQPDQIEEIEEETTTRRQTTRKKPAPKEPSGAPTWVVGVIGAVILSLIAVPLLLAAVVGFATFQIFTQAANSSEICAQSISASTVQTGALSSDFKSSAGQRQLAQVILNTAYKENMGENGALMAIYVAMSESGLVNKTTSYIEASGNMSSSRGMYQQLEGWAKETAWSGIQPPAGQLPSNYFIDKNAWGTNGWAEADLRMDPERATIAFLDSLRVRLKKQGISRSQFKAMDLTDAQMFQFAQDVQRFGEVGQYDTNQPKARILLNDIMGDPIDINGGWSVNNAVYTTSTGGITRPINAALGTPYGKEGSAWSSGRHTGSDYPAPEGTPLFAVAPAHVTFAGKTIGTYENGYGPYGNMVDLQAKMPDGSIVDIRYAHLSKVNVVKGQYVTTGQLIGEVGNTGNVYPRGAGWHLHFEIKVNGTQVDPEEWLKNTNAGNPGTIAQVDPVFFVGDSLLYGSTHYGNTGLRDAMTGYEFTYDAREGRFTEEGIKVLSPNPDADGDENLFANPNAQTARTWVLQLGTNDAHSGRSQADYAAMIDEVMGLAGDRNVIWVNTYIQPGTGSPVGVTNVNAALDAAAGRYPNLKIIDYNAMIQANVRFMESDGIHLDADGYRWLAGLYASALAGLNPYSNTGASPDCNEAVEAMGAGLPDGSEYGAAPATNPYAAVAVAYGLAQVGDRYVAGATGPDAFDCSGFTAMAWKEAGVKLVNYSYTQWEQVERLPGRYENLQPGDLLFYFEGDTHHVSMYIGNGKMVHAANPGKGVLVQDITDPWYDARFTGAGRPALPSI